ncbi:MAG: cell division protease FtsH, partial [Desulfomicrobiaceae bacterium]|nr:cell division protease FtsH [Desulfomicrobiaceae bacterium]
MENRHWHVGYWLVAIMLLLLFQEMLQTYRSVETVPYSAFEQALAQGKVAEVTIGEQVITGKLKAPEGRTIAIAAARVEPDLAERLDRYGVPYTRVVENTFLRDLISWVAPALVFFAVWYFLFRR